MMKNHGSYDGEPVADLDGFFHLHSRVEGVTTHYVVGGSGPAIVLLHGWPTSWREWRAIMPALAAAGRTVIVPDLRGLGDSDKPEGGYAKHLIANDVRAIVHELGFERVDLVGSDIGAMVAFAWSLHYPDDIEHLVLAETLLPGFGLEEMMNPAYGGYWHFGFHAQVEVATMLTAGKEEPYLGGMWDLFSPAGGITDDDRAEWLRTYSAPGGMRAGFQHYATLLEDGQSNRKAFGFPLSMPILVLNGELGIPSDPLFRGIDQVALHVHRAIIAGAGHAFAADRPEVSARIILSFCSTP